MTFRGSFFKAPKVKRSKGRARPEEPLATWCEVGRAGVCTGRAEVRHHILPRSQGGTDEKSNTVDCCDSDHRWIHANPSKAYAHGWLLHRPVVDNWPTTQLPEGA
jgi:hypothetical protein